jgi:hypothetical protein
MQGTWLDPGLIAGLLEWRLRGPMLFGFGQARLWILLAILVLILVITLVNRRNR